MRIFLYILFVSSMSTFATARELPDNVCYTDPCDDRNCRPYVCNAEGLRIFDQMKTTGCNIVSIPQPGVYSGRCHYRGRDYKHSARRDYAGLLFDDQSGSLQMAGAFSEYIETNKYKTIDVEEAREIWSGRKEYLFKHYESHSFLDKNPGGESPIFYWISQKNGYPNIIQILAFWGYNRLALCELSLNNN